MLNPDIDRSIKSCYQDLKKQVTGAKDKIDVLRERMSAEAIRRFDQAEDVYGGPIGYLKRDVAREYIVTIVDNRPRLKDKIGVRTKQSTQRQKVTIRALLQEQFEMATEADWSPLTAATIVTRFGAEAAALVQRSLVSRWLSRRIWRGTSPIDFTLKLRFEAERDALREVKLPCMELQRLNLPYVGNKVAGEMFLSPPGPAPIQLGTPEDKGMGEIINITIGGLVYIKRCVVKRVSVTYHDRFEVGGNPLGADVLINFQTYEIMTKESLDTGVYEAPKLGADTPGI